MTDDKSQHAIAYSGTQRAPEPAPPEDAALYGFRESNKADKRRRIRAAARTLFSEQGYDGTTLRQIARHARVALGTLSLYARDKRDLVLLIFNERIPAIHDRALATAAKEDNFLEKLVTFFRVLDEEFFGNLTLARIHLQLNYYSGGMHSAEYYANRQRVFDFVEQAVREGQKAGEISTTEDPAFVARHVFFVYSASLRWWIASENPDLDARINDLRRLFRLLIMGLAPGKGDRAKHKRRKAGPLRAISTRQKRRVRKGVDRLC